MRESRPSRQADRSGVSSVRMLGRWKVTWTLSCASWRFNGSTARWLFTATRCRASCLPRVSCIRGAACRFSDRRPPSSWRSRVCHCRSRPPRTARTLIDGVRTTSSTPTAARTHAIPTMSGCAPPCVSRSRSSISMASRRTLRFYKQRHGYRRRGVMMTSGSGPVGWTISLLRRVNPAVRRGRGVRHPCARRPAPASAPRSSMWYTAGSRGRAAPRR